jgi:hypothetical protein
LGGGREGSCVFHSTFLPLPLTFPLRHHSHTRREALASPLCTAVHLTRVDVDDADCDTFMSPLDPAAWRLWSATPPRSDPERAPGAGGGPGPRYSFECHVRAGLAGPPADGFPPGMAAPHDEEQVGNKGGGEGTPPPRVGLGLFLE